jgi:hypothetical protein
MRLVWILVTLVGARLLMSAFERPPVGDPAPARQREKGRAVHFRCLENPEADCREMSAGGGAR